jgi:uncharacterized membrane protein YgdD (TMEM256/DUF423 family)
MSARLLWSSLRFFYSLRSRQGAFGAHALKARTAPELLAVYQTAVQYHFWHALGLLAIGVMLVQKPDSGALAIASWLLVAGMVLFSGSLYALALTGVRGLGAGDADRWHRAPRGVGSDGLGGVALVINRPSRPTP